MMKKKIVFAEKYGVCSGVKNALNLVNQELTSNNSQIYVFHEIVHNSFVINNLKKNGVIFTENINTIPDHSTIIFSAHGVSKEIEKQAAAKKLKVIDGTCPLVKKNHKIVEDAEARGDYIIFIGDPKHVEVSGTYGRCVNKDKFFIVHSEQDIKKLPQITTPVTLLSQTTLSTDDTQTIIELLKQKYPQLVNYGGICHATDSRQGAIRTLAARSDIILIIGSPKSSNSKQLVNIAKRLNKVAYLVENSLDLERIDFTSVETIGISAGASTPQEQIDLIVNSLQIK
ncbi:MAG: 4-hydroxy-3-methylbut-2-enyl diphosphate reductase [Lentisphaeria bacterium]|nr:4-hydroxy-3-methylbut-2-enyl diphosphate reductase [Lentisphaeria bacterium]